ncbi:hypothetical protein SAMN05660880_00002 [Luteibacter sp. 22Crub2.1]|nr:hypothetical protein SAMN05660880_00002 [Luteibacter sp. 22Crub2.1]
MASHVRCSRAPLAYHELVTVSCGDHMEQNDGIFPVKVPKGHNSTFGPGKDWFMNACVGTNTGANPWEGYHGGFQAGAEVLLAAAGVSRPRGASESWGMPNVDYLVYPVCLCARHHVELSLKLAIPQAWNIFKRRSPSSNKGLQEPPKQDDRHGLLPIWETLNEVSDKADQRLAKVVSGLERYIDDFNKVDPTGQVFRYATGLDNSLHLNDITHINLQTFAERYAKLCGELESLHILLSVLTQEYATGSFTAELNREQLTEIAESLPDRSHWNSEDFDKIKKDLIERYGLTSRGFQRAVSKIEETRALAVKIGIVEPLTEITRETFEKVMSASEDAFRSNPGFSPEECAAISALLLISDFEYPEHFAWHARPLSAEADEDRAAALENEREWSHLSRKVCQRPDRLLRGLLLLGQTELGAQLRLILNVKFENLERVRVNGKKSSKSFLAKGNPSPR